MNTHHNYKVMLTPPTTKTAPQSRKVWSIDLEQVWVKLFMATNATVDTTIPSAALGHPLQLAYDKAGAVRFSPSGRPVRRVAKEIGDHIRLAREYFTASLIEDTKAIIQAYPAEYQTQVAMAQKAGIPLKNWDGVQESNALKARADAEAAAIAKAAADAEAVKAEATAQAEEANKPKGRNKVRELVPA